MEKTALYPSPATLKRLESSAAGAHWQRVGLTHRHGVAIPLFSLRTQTSGGIGEYPDLIPLIDWCADVGFSIIQLLPLNDTGPDSSPYSALSAYALNPLNLSLRALEGAPDDSELQRLNGAERIPYDVLRPKKLQLLDEYVSRHRDRIASMPAFQQFMQEHRWLAPYAVFKAFRQQHNRSAWWDWPQEVRQPTTALLEQHHDAIIHHGIIQFLCDQQLLQARAHANSRGVLLMGDIPILLSPNSADVWWKQHYFDLSAAVGAPPDQFSADGQNWGFPLYQWDALRADHFDWWKERLQFASRYFQLYRIDHIVGFFRFFRIPKGKTGREGHFVPEALPAAIDLGRQLLAMMLQSTTMLPIGEDLGAVPPEVRVQMSELGICGTRVMRWERYWNGDQSFIPVSLYIPESAACVSTHDTEPLALWWSDHPDESRRYAEEKKWNWEPHLSFERRRDLLHDCHHSGSFFHVNPLQEYLALFPDLVKGDPRQDRINVPGTASSDNWSYRFKISMDELMRHDGLRQQIRDLIL